MTVGSESALSSILQIAFEVLPMYVESRPLVMSAVRRLGLLVGAAA
jgi:hypothetical protein